MSSEGWRSGCLWLPDESFRSLETATGRLSACLWTYCTDPHPWRRVADGCSKQDGRPGILSRTKARYSAMRPFGLVRPHFSDIFFICLAQHQRARSLFSALRSRIGRQPDTGTL
jgi:hypothetical protein